MSADCHDSFLNPWKNDLIFEAFFVYTTVFSILKAKEEWVSVIHRKNKFFLENLQKNVFSTDEKCIRAHYRVPIASQVSWTKSKAIHAKLPSELSWPVHGATDSRINWKILHEECVSVSIYDPNSSCVLKLAFISFEFVQDKGSFC